MRYEFTIAKNNCDKITKYVFFFIFVASINNSMSIKCCLCFSIKQTQGLLSDHLIISKIFIFLYHPYCCYVNTKYNLFAHSCLYYFLLSLQCTVCTFYFISHSILYFIIFSVLLCIFSCVCIPYNCTVH